MTRATNVFMSPAELYTEVASTPVQTSSWLIPFILSILITVLFTFALYNNPDLRSQIYDMQAQGMRTAVEQGRMTQEQADTVRDQMESSGPVVFILFGSVSAGFMVVIVFFGAALVLWLAAKFFMKFTGSYKKMLESFGLSSFIGLLGSIIALLMMNLLGSMLATPSGAFFIRDSFDRTNFVHGLLASMNVFTIWQVAVVGLALSKLSGKSTGMGLAIAFGLWLVWTIIASLLGFGMR